MDKRLTDAFDSMKMPSGCARRIEQALLEKAHNTPEKEEFTVKKAPSGSHYGWLAAGLVCLAAVVVTGFALPSRSEPQETTVATETTVAEETMVVPDWLAIDNRTLKMKMDGSFKSVEWRFDAEEPLLYCDRQEDGTVLYIALGGDYDASFGYDSIGWYSAVWNPDTQTWSLEAEWNCYDPETGEETPWFTKVLDKQDQIPALAEAKEEWENGLLYVEGRTSYGMSPGSSYTRVLGEYHTPFTDYEDGRVYFVSNDEHIDITDQFSEEEPFTYIYTDRKMVIHYIAIGGTPDNMGYLEMCYGTWESSKAFHSSVAGCGVNTWNYETEDRYGWEQKAKEIFGEYGVYWVS